MRPEGRDALLTAVAQVLDSAPGPKVGIVYGSAARDQMGPHSDVDVAVGFGRPMGTQERVALWVALARAVGREVDLVDLETLDGYLWEPLFEQGKFVVRNHDLVVKYVGKAQAYHEDCKAAQMQIIDHRLDEAFGPL